MSIEMNSTTGAHAAQPSIDEKSVLHRVVEGTHQPFDLFGPTVEFLVLPEEAQNEFSVLRGVIPPGFSVPMHSHPSTEDFFIISGQAQALKQVPGGYEWIDGKAGDYFHVPSGARQAWRNVTGEPLVVLINFLITLPAHEVSPPIILQRYKVFLRYQGANRIASDKTKGHRVPGGPAFWLLEQDSNL